MNAYFLYKKFGTRPFFTAEGFEALEEMAPYKIGKLSISGLKKRKYIEDRLSKEEVIDKVKDFSWRKNYQKLTPKAIEYCRWLDDNKSIVTKYLLKL